MEHPKPTIKKRPKAKNNKADYTLRVCVLCRQRLICTTHEVYGGINRQISITYGYQVPLCGKCHEKVTQNKEDTILPQKKWRETFQIQRERSLINKGLTPEEARESWMRTIGRNYL